MSHDLITNRGGLQERSLPRMKEQTSDITPLQSHNITIRTWTPPTNEPFITYEPSDEPWASYCGIGTYEDLPVDVYDVLDHEQNLMGYTFADPGQHERLDIAVPRHGNFMKFVEVSPGVHVKPNLVINVIRETALYEDPDKDRIWWAVLRADARELIHNGWLVDTQSIKQKYLEHEMKKLQVQNQAAGLIDD